MTKPKRFLLKLSGESFADDSGRGLDQERLLNVAGQIKVALQEGVEIGIVVGGGNFLRGATSSNEVITRTTADQMGILATLLNGLAVSDALNVVGCKTKLYSAMAVQGVADAFDYRRAIASLEAGRIVIFAGGTGNPFVTTDSTASLRAVEINADVLLKATKVDGIYAKDPKKYPDAKRYDRITFQQALREELAVMDLAAFCQCRDYNVPIRVFDVFQPNALRNVLLGADEGTLVFKGENDD